MNQNNKHDCAVVIFNDSWGEIDTVLPLIKKFKKKKRIKIISIFRHQKNFENKARFRDLMYILNKISFEIYTPENTLHHRLIQNLFYLLQHNFFSLIKIITLIIFFKNINEIDENLFIQRILKKYNVKYIFSGQASPANQEWLVLDYKKLVFFPQAITLRGFKFRKKRNFNFKKYDLERKKKYLNYQIYPDDSIFLTNDQSEKNYFKKYLPKNFKFNNIGYLRLNSQWIKEKKKIFNKNKKIKKKYIFVLLGKESYLGKNEIRIKFKNILNAARDNKIGVLYKFHPKSVFDLSKIIKDYKDVYIEESKNSVLYDALQSEMIVVTSKTGSSMDCIKISKPVLDYYNLGNKIKLNIQNEFKINKKITTLYRYYGLVYPVNNCYELKKNIYKILNNKQFKKRIVASQKKSLKKYLNFN